MLGPSGAGCANGADVSKARPGLLAKLERGGRVLVAAAGIAGHSGMSSSLYFLSLEAASRTRLLRSEETYRRALPHHQVLRTATRPTLCDGAFCMALNVGLDNRRPLPPFLPVQRNQDGVFGALVRVCRGDGFFGFLPGAVPHIPPAPRPLSPDDLWRDAAALRAGQIVLGLIRSIAAPTGQTAVGRALAEWGALPAADFDELLRIRVGTAMKPAGVPSGPSAASVWPPLPVLGRRCSPRPGCAARCDGAA
ncbi:MAG TPA: hypothetical protein VMS17_27785 [Gemmataceae bacterium]|nr:hypothetical protein [Gemmataceae bacterium]